MKTKTTNTAGQSAIAGAPRPKRTPQLVDAAVAAGRGPALTLVRAGLLVALVAVVTLIGLSSSSSLRFGLTLGAIYGMGVLATGLVQGVLGEINLATGAWMALGAYVCARMTNAGVPLILTLAAVVVASGVLGGLFAIPTVRLKGIFTALVTFVLAFAVPSLILYLEPLTGGYAGLSIPVAPTLFGSPISGSAVAMMLVANGAFVLVALATLAFLESKLGRTSILTGEAEAATSVFGVWTLPIKICTWAWCSAVAGLAGALLALTVGYINSDLFPAFLSIAMLIGSVLAGPRSVWGALLGGILVGTVPGELQDFVPATATGILFGCMLLLAILAGAGGVSRLVESGAVRLYRIARGATR